MFSAAKGKTMVSPAEGGLFELSDNDDFAAAPGLGQMLAGGNTSSNPETRKHTKYYSCSKYNRYEYNKCAIRKNI